MAKRETCIQAALTLKAQLDDTQGKLESQAQELNLRIEQLSSERDRLTDQIAFLERDLKTAVAANGSLTEEKSSAEQRFRVRVAPARHPFPSPNSDPFLSSRILYHPFAISLPPS
jgi:hypothetical protein